MKVMAAGKAKNAFGLLLDTARAEPVTIEKHGRPVAVVLSAEAYERLSRRAKDAAKEPSVIATGEHDTSGKPLDRMNSVLETT